MNEATKDGASASKTPNKPGNVFTMLENNPETMNDLAYSLGVSKDVSFYDVFSVYDADMLAFIPRPVYALLTTIPLTEAWKEDRRKEDSGMQMYQGAGPNEPAIWFKQTIIHGCGLIGLLHCVMNGIPSNMIKPGSILAEFMDKAIPLRMDERAQLLSDSDQMYEASEAVAVRGDSHVLRQDEPAGNHYVALVKGRDGHLYELEGDRKGPLDRGLLGEDEDVLSEHGLELGIKRLIDLQREGGGSVRFSCIALAPTID